MYATRFGAAGVDVDDFVEVHVYVSDCVIRGFCAVVCKRMGDVEGEVKGLVFKAAVIFYGEALLHFEVSECDVVGFCFAFVVVEVAVYAAVEEVFHLLGCREECVYRGLHVLDCDHYAGIARTVLRFEFLSRGIDAVEEAAEVEVVIAAGLPFGCPSSRVQGQDFGTEVVSR